MRTYHLTLAAFLSTAHFGAGCSPASTGLNAAQMGAENTLEEHVEARGPRIAYGVQDGVARELTRALDDRQAHQREALDKLSVGLNAAGDHASLRALDECLEFFEAGGLDGHIETCFKNMTGLSPYRPDPESRLPTHGRPNFHHASMHHKHVGIEIRPDGTAVERYAPYSIRLNCETSYALLAMRNPVSDHSPDYLDARVGYGVDGELDKETMFHPFRTENDEHSEFVHFGLSRLRTYSGAKRVNFRIGQGHPTTELEIDVDTVNDSIERLQKACLLPIEGNALLMGEWF